LIIISKIDLSSIGQTKEATFEYDWKRSVLYNLGIGAQAEDLPFVYENAEGGLKIFPSFATIVGASALLFPKGTDFIHLLHGEQLIRLYLPFEPEGIINTRAVIEHIYDKGKAAVIHTKISGYSLKDEHIFDTRYVFFVVGSGGFGGNSGPKTENIAPPVDKKPDFSFPYQTSPNQAALYRLNGDLNPLHIDPKFAKKAGQPKPILHGLCTYGIATRAIVYGLCDGDVSRLQEFNARFKDVVFPGDFLITEGWEDNGRYIIQVRKKDTIVLGNAYAIVK